MKCEPSTPLFLSFQFQHLKAEDLEMKNGTEREDRGRNVVWRQRERTGCKERKGEGDQQKDGRHREENETEELQEGNEKRKVKVEMQEDCILLRLLCALAPIPYLMDLVWSAGLKRASVLCQTRRTSAQPSQDTFWLTWTVVHLLMAQKRRRKWNSDTESLIAGLKLYLTIWQNISLSSHNSNYLQMFF